MLRSSSEFAVTFDCLGDQLLGIVHPGQTDAELGTVIVVGGPQYRIGSHRMFVEIARQLSELGNLVMRFDCRGMGDSDGEFRSFETISDDIHSAIEALSEVTSARKFVLVGLCDGASASLMYVPQDSRVVGLVLMNPYVHSQTSEAKARMKHYYLNRLTQLDFWRRLLRGKGSLFHSIISFGSNLTAAARTDPAQPRFVDRMLAALQTFAGKVLVILSPDDLTAQEFGGLEADSAKWADALRRPNVVLTELDAADHTFSGEGQIQNVARMINDFLARLHTEDVRAECS